MRKKLIDKDDLVREIEKLKSNLIYGACASQIAMETRCKEEAYNEVLSYLDTLEVKEDKVKDNWECIQDFIEKLGHFPKDCDELDVLINYVLSKKQKFALNEEVDIEKEFDKCCENHIFDDDGEVYTARKFFELGLKKARKGK